MIFFSGCLMRSKLDERGSSESPNDEGSQAEITSSEPLSASEYEARQLCSSCIQSLRFAQKMRSLPRQNVAFSWK
jgi:hypothetical protein